MKPLCSLFVVLGLVSAAGLAQDSSTHPAPDLLRVQKMPTSLRVELHDPQSRAWTLQTSRDLRHWHWKPARSLRVANTDWRTQLSTDPNQPSLFVRAVAASEASPLTTAQALNLDLFEYKIFAILPPELRARARSFSTAPERPESLEQVNEGATLGRVLFHDRRLSKNHNVSCASCHQQKHAFSDPRRVSVGTDGKAGTRNAPSLVNTNFSFHGGFFWDRRAGTLEEAVLLPIQDPNEMGITLDEACERVAAETYYEELFIARFGDAEVTPDRLAIALSQFLRSIVSVQSKFDLNRGGFSVHEERGWWLFQRNCYTCHTAGSFQRDDNGHIGLEAGSIDLGIGAVTGNPDDAGVFKIPTLRNIALTAPYMHDGRFETLEEVLDHYTESPHLEMKHESGQSLFSVEGGLQFTAQEKSDLLAFLHTLTDEELITDPRYSDPFRYGDNDKTVEGGP